MKLLDISSTKNSSSSSSSSKESSPYPIPNTHSSPCCHHHQQNSLHLETEFKILTLLSEGAFSKIYLARKRSSSSETLVLKSVHSNLTSFEEFSRELNLNYFLSPHPSITTCYNISFTWNNNFVFVQEHAPFGSLSRFMKKGIGLPESQVKLISKQIASALEFMHSLKIVHRDVTPNNILVFKESMEIVKLSDFGCARVEGSLVVRTDSAAEGDTFAPPEISDLLPQEKYHCFRSSDVWQVGILILTCLKGSAPWAVADNLTDVAYRQYESWLRRKSLKIPENLKGFSLRFLRLVKRLLEPREGMRSGVREVRKYLGDEWIRRNRGKRAVTVAGVGSVKRVEIKKRHSQDDCHLVGSGSQSRLSQQSNNKDELLSHLKETDEIESSGGSSSRSKRVEDWVVSSASVISCGSIKEIES